MHPSKALAHWSISQVSAHFPYSIPDFTGTPSRSVSLYVTPVAAPIKSLVEVNQLGLTLAIIILRCDHRLSIPRLPWYDSAMIPPTVRRSAATARTADFCEEIRELLRRYYTQFPGEVGRHEILSAQLRAGEDVFVRTNLTGHVTTSATVLNGSGDKVLLIHHRIFEKWLPPGGHYEAPGSLWESALREVAEETGVSNAGQHPWMLGSGLPVDIDTHFIPENAAKGEGAHVHHDFRFLAIAPDELPLCAQLEEVHEVRWAPLADLRDSPDDRVRALHAKLVRLQVLRPAVA